MDDDRLDPDAVNELAERFFAAIEAGDLDAAIAWYAPDAVVWHNYDDAEQGVAQNRATLGWLCANVANRSYGDVRRVVVGDGFVQQHVLRGDAPGGPLALAAMMRVHCVTTPDGLRITRLDEYFDTGALGVLRRGSPEPSP
jgi:ketosteroid isomerase-like protein